MECMKMKQKIHYLQLLKCYFKIFQDLMRYWRKEEILLNEATIPIILNNDLFTVLTDDDVIILISSAIFNTI